MNTEFCSNTLPYVLPEFRFRYPEIEVQIREGHNRLLFDELESGRWISSIPPTACPPWRLPTTSSTASRSFWAMPADHPWREAWICPTTPRLTPYYIKPELVRNCDFIVIDPWEQGMEPAPGYVS